MIEPRKIIHIDMDAFFASVEQRDNPFLRGKPLVVGGSPQSRGVVAACSYEARKFGVHSAMPCSKAQRLCPDAIFVKPRMSHYKNVSVQIMTIFQKYTSLVEPLSLDEAFLDVTANRTHSGSATLIAETLCKHIYTETMLTASAGISYNKFLAKIASDINKPRGITTIKPDEAQVFINNLPISKFFGVGKATETKMKQFGIQAGVDLLRYSRETLISRFGKHGSFFYDIARGIDNRPVKSERKRKSIGKETTFKTDVTSMSVLKESFLHITGQLGVVLQRNKKIAYTVSVKIRFNDFTTITRSSTTERAITNAEEINRHLPHILKNCTLTLKPIRLIGVSLSKLSKAQRFSEQLVLPFMNEIKPKQSLDDFFEKNMN